MSASAVACENRFEPQLPGFSQVPFNDLPALHAAVDAQTVAIMLEPIQSGGGVLLRQNITSRASNACVVSWGSC